MKLYGTLTSPYVRKSRVLIEEKRLPVEFVAADPSKEGSPIVGWNPLGKVPVLEIGPGSYLFDSDIVGRYLDVAGHDHGLHQAESRRAAAGLARAA